MIVYVYKSIQYGLRLKYQEISVCISKASISALISEYAKMTNSWRPLLQKALQCDAYVCEHLQGSDTHLTFPLFVSLVFNTIS